MNTYKEEVDYVRSKIGTVSEVGGRVIQGVTPLLQSNFGGKSDGDCVITSMTTCFTFLTGKDPALVYKTIVNNINPRWAFNPNIYGTIPLFNTSIAQSAAKALGCNASVSTGFLKDIGYNYQTIMKSIERNRPVVLVVASANDGYYKFHGVTVIGCRTYKSYTGAIKRMLIIYDNWEERRRFIDYDTISQFSCATYIV